MPHLVHTRLSGLSRTSLSLSGENGHLQDQPATATDGVQSSSPKQHVIDREGWPPFPPPQSLSDDTKQLHQTLRSSPPHSHSHSHSPSPSHTPSASLDPDSLVPPPTPLASGIAVGGSAEPEQGNNKNSKKNTHLSAGTLASLLSTNHNNNPEDKRERKERKLAEKLAKHEQALQDLRTADRRRAYFRDASHRRELIFGPEVRTHAGPAENVTSFC